MAQPDVVLWMFRSRALLYATLLAGCFLTGSVRADDWPQWRGPARTGHGAPGSPVLATLVAEPKLIWRLRIGEGFASPIVAGGKVFYFDNQAGKETLHALNPENGDELWRTAVDDTFQDEQGPPGPRCTPVKDGDRVYAQSGKGELQCLSVAGGKRLWPL